MRFSVFLNCRSTAPEHDRFVMQASVRHAELAESLGFDAIFLPDHHFTGYAPMASDPFVFAAYLAAKLPRMHFGFSVVTVPLHHPIRFTERVNLLDQLTDGKVLVGVGSGTTPEEMIGFGVNYQETSKVSEENLKIAENLWAKTIDDPTVQFDTGHYKGVVLERIAPTAYSKGHARLMPVAMKEASARRAAENAWPAFIPAFTPPKIGGLEPFKHVQKYFKVYYDLLTSQGHSDAAIAAALDWTTHTYQCVHVAETDEKAYDEMLTILRAYQAAVDRELEHNLRAERMSSADKTDNTPNALTEDWIGTWCCYGSPKTVAEKLRPYFDLGIGNVLLGSLTGPLTPEREATSNRSLELFGKQVIPLLKNARAAA
ncbi:MAG: LLM class flavin-dependent oxidoreductase [Hyphomonadaceae bacterium]|nr:LLM class flavin-dependent oxidoreductase [Hyphomonadaceae bacterium]